MHKTGGCCLFKLPKHFLLLKLSDLNFDSNLELVLIQNEPLQNLGGPEHQVHSHLHTGIV